MESVTSMVETVLLKIRSMAANALIK